MLSKPKERLTQFAKWLGKTVAENIVGTILVSSTGLFLLSTLLSSVGEWLYILLNTPPSKWPVLSIAIVLLVFSLLWATLLYVLIKIVRYFRTPFVWTELAGFKWKTYRLNHETDWMPYCPVCQIQLTDLNSGMICTQCSKRWNGWSFDNHDRFHKAANNHAVATLQKHIKK
jgi:hypothetical protein